MSLTPMDLSLVIPLLNEADSLQELTEWIVRVVDSMAIEYEIIFIDDGSTDNSWDIIAQLNQKHPTVRGIRFTRNYGKAPGLQTGFTEAQGRVVITMDADLQDSPDEIPELYNMVSVDGHDLVSGWKKKRYDPITKTIPTKLYNASARLMTGIQLHDFNCGLKAYKLSLVKDIEVYGDMHRYIPVLAKWAGYNRIAEKVVQHQPRKHGKTKYGWQRFVNGPLDLMSIMFVGKFGKRPMHFFGSFGSFFFAVGFLILIYLSYMKIVEDTVGITDRPMFYLGILTVIIGTQLFVTGFLAELITGISDHRRHYLIADKIPN